jgi:hypothetical protein
MLILGIDPGETTGCAILEVGSANRVTLRAQAFTTKTVAEFSGLFNLKNLITSTPWDVIALESFTPYAHKAQSLVGNKLWTSQLIGMIKLVAFDYGIDVKENNASRAKTLWPDAMLKNYGVYSESKHVRDATRHALLVGDVANTIIKFGTLEVV